LPIENRLARPPAPLPAERYSQTLDSRAPGIEPKVRLYSFANRKSIGKATLLVHGSTLCIRMLDSRETDLLNYFHGYKLCPPPRSVIQS
jgi:hypothetical protein